MSIYHPIFDDEKRVWDLPSALDFEKLKSMFSGEIALVHTKKGYIAWLLQTTTQQDYCFMSTRRCDVDDPIVEPLWESINNAFWEEYIVPHIIPPAMIDMTGEFDADDIELAQIIMDEIDGGR